MKQRSIHSPERLPGTPLRRSPRRPGRSTLAAGDPDMHVDGVDTGPSIPPPPESGSPVNEEYFMQDSSIEDDKKLFSFFRRLSKKQLQEIGPLGAKLEWKQG